MLSVKESAPKMRSSSVMVIQLSVFLLVAVFSTIVKGCPGLTSVILKNEEPKSNPITLQDTCDELRSTRVTNKSVDIFLEKFLDV